uniref:Bidirectional sugar transporter SWEET n=1 Tax=Zea mays TaxID=4577 RepID=A0A804PHT7_MAIZE
MAFLNMEQQTWAFTFGILGNIISLMVFLSPLPTFYRVYRKKSTEGFQSTPYVVTLFSCMLWIFYALLKSGAELLVTINGVGCVIEAAYLAAYLVYAPKMLLGLNVGVFGLAALATMVVSSAGLRVRVLGWICVSVALSVFAAPLSIMRQVVRTKSVEFMPISLSFFLVLSAVIWFAYGALKRDVFVAFPNVLGFVFGVAQIALYMAYRNKEPAAVTVEEAKLPEHAKEVVVAAAAAEARASCGAEVHPIDIDIEATPTPVEEVHEPQVVVVVDVDVEPVTCAGAAEAAAGAGADASGVADGGVPGPMAPPEQLAIKPDMAISVEA